MYQGLKLQGLRHNALANYNSTPGLSFYVDSKKPLGLVSGRVAQWDDQSIFNNNVTASVTRRPYVVNDLWVMSDNGSIYLNRYTGSSHFTFLHNGSKFGIYTIMKNDWALASPASVLGSVATAVASEVGMQSLLGSDLSSGRFASILRGDTSASPKAITNILNPIHANYVPSGTIVTTSLVNRGQTLGVTSNFGSAVLTTITPFFPDIADYPTTGTSGNIRICSGSPSLVVYTGLVLIYNWTGYSDAQVLVFDTQVKSLLAQDLTIFQTLDA